MPAGRTARGLACTRRRKRIRATQVIQSQATQLEISELQKMGCCAVGFNFVSRALQKCISSF